MKILGYFSTIKRKINTVFFSFLTLCLIGFAILYKLHAPIDSVRKVELKTQKSLKILNDLTFNSQKVIHHESKFKRNFTQRIEDFEHMIFDIAETRHFITKSTDSSRLKEIVSIIFLDKTETSEEQVLLTDILESWEKVKLNFLLIRDQPTYKDSTIISYEPEEEYVLTDDYVPGSRKVNASTNIIFKKRTHHISTLNPQLKEAWHYDDIYSEALKKQLEKLFSYYQKTEQSSTASFDQYLLIIILILASYLLLAGFFIQKNVYAPLYLMHRHAKNALDTQRFHAINPRSEELKDIQQLILKQSEQINAATNYIEKMTSGDNVLEVSTIDGQLVHSLNSMRQKIQEVRHEEEVRNWQTQGMAEFSEILRTENNNLHALSEKLVNKFVHYLEAVQGAIFLVNKGKDKNFLRLESSYAYDRKKYLNKAIEWGEGLIGQAWQEGEPIYLTNVPENHFTIKSGLGAASPKCILIVPIKDGNDIYGVLEIATLKPLEEYKRVFVEQIAITIASSIASVQLSEQTTTLLQQAQEMTQQMRLHEEEMRQNMEELKATQEDAVRREKEKEEELTRQKEDMKALEQNWKKQLDDAQQKIAKLRSEVESASIDNEAIRALKGEIETLKTEFEATEKDLKETIKIKDMRIEKLRSKLNNQ